MQTVFITMKTSPGLASKPELRVASKLFLEAEQSSKVPYFPPNK